MFIIWALWSSAPNLIAISPTVTKNCLLNVKNINLNVMLNEKSGDKQSLMGSSSGNYEYLYKILEHSSQLTFQSGLKSCRGRIPLPSKKTI